MEYAQPGRVSFSGTYHANPLCIAAAHATLTELMENEGAAYKHLRKIGESLQNGIEELIRETHSEAIIQGVGPGGFQIYFTKLSRIRDYREFTKCDTGKYGRFHKELLKRGVYTHPGQNEHWFVSTAHNEQDVKSTLNVVRESLNAVK